MGICKICGNIYKNVGAHARLAHPGETVDQIIAEVPPPPVLQEEPPDETPYMVVTAQAGRVGTFLDTFKREMANKTERLQIIIQIAVAGLLTAFFIGGALQLSGTSLTNIPFFSFLYFRHFVFY